MRLREGGRVDLRTSSAENIDRAKSSAAPRGLSYKGAVRALRSAGYAHKLHPEGLDWSNLTPERRFATYMICLTCASRPGEPFIEEWVETIEMWCDIAGVDADIIKQSLRRFKREHFLRAASVVKMDMRKED